MAPIAARSSRPFASPGDSGAPLIDPAGESPQGVGVGGEGELVEMRSVVGQEADVKALARRIQSGVQGVCGLLGARDW